VSGASADVPVVEKDMKDHLERLEAQGVEGID